MGHPRVGFWGVSWDGAGRGAERAVLCARSKHALGSHEYIQHCRKFDIDIRLQLMKRKGVRSDLARTVGAGEGGARWGRPCHLAASGAPTGGRATAQHLSISRPTMTRAPPPSTTTSTCRRDPSSRPSAGRGGHGGTAPPRAVLGAHLAGAELCSLSPRQALSLLFDTFHNEVDAFLAAEVSTGGTEGAFLGPPCLICSGLFPPFCYGAQRVNQRRRKA